MTAIKNFRVDSFVSGLAFKAPCIINSIANLTLSAEQTVNSVAVVVGDRVLVMAQTDPIENGIYNVETSAWQRSGDFDGARDATRGTQVSVLAASGADNIYQLDSANPVVIDVDAINWSLRPAAGGTSSVVRKIATADQDFSSVTCAAHDQLKGWIMDASKLYRVQGEVWGKAQFSSGGMRWEWGYDNLPTGGEFLHHSNSASGLSTVFRNVRTIQGNAQHVHSAIPNFAEYRMEISGLIRANAAGTVLDWEVGQSSASANVTKINRGSWIELELLD